MELGSFCRTTIKSSCMIYLRVIRENGFVLPNLAISFRCPPLAIDCGLRLGIRANAKASERMGSSPTYRHDQRKPRRRLPTGPALRSGRPVPCAA
jgi:hypothetical protein